METQTFANPEVLEFYKSLPFNYQDSVEMLSRATFFLLRFQLHKRIVGGSHDFRVKTRDYLTLGINTHRRDVKPMKVQVRCIETLGLVKDSMTARTGVGRLRYDCLR